MLNAIVTDMSDMKVKDPQIKHIYEVNGQRMSRGMFYLALKKNGSGQDIQRTPVDRTTYSNPNASNSMDCSQ